ncbi:hypothetical protein HW555_000833 [Spodoptera exigua]|uniref:Cathepsin propeptide inhibitor domain-containing protein n=1 Tax=Spodoptera exigua TaxID=7107 RepID=A0A835GSV4_SPOEX|nr:hypothetical protein HW555_000833 [Spodoptera exigua]
MRFISIVLVFVVLAIVNAAPAVENNDVDYIKPYYDTNKAPELFEKFIKDYNKKYKDEADKQVHYQAFVKFLKKINKFNAISPDTVFDINYLADYTEEEMQNLFGLKSRGIPGLFKSGSILCPSVARKVVSSKKVSELEGNATSQVLGFQ